MMGLIVAVHVIVCIALIILVLIQRGKGGGLVESFSGIESMLGTKTNAFLTRSTTVLSVIFFLTCLSLAFLSVKQSKSLMQNAQTKPSAAKSADTKAAPEQAQTQEKAVAETPAASVKPQTQATAVEVPVPATQTAVDQGKQAAQKAQ
jgi:preprotein translocase subunit SecG